MTSPYPISFWILCLAYPFAWGIGHSLLTSFARALKRTAELRNPMPLFTTFLHLDNVDASYFILAICVEIFMLVMPIVPLELMNHCMDITMQPSP